MYLGENLSKVKTILDELVVGEDENKILLYLSLIKGQSIIVRGDTSTGKNRLCDSVLSLFPAESIFEITSGTAKILRWLDTDYIDILYLREVRMSAFEFSESQTETPLFFDIKQAMSDKTLKIAFVQNLKGVNQTAYKILRIHSILQTTSEYNLNEDIENRAWILTTDSSTAQTKRVLQYKARRRQNINFKTISDEELFREVKKLTSEKLNDKRRISIPFADMIVERLCQRKSRLQPRMRRDIDKFFDLIESIAHVNSNRSVATEEDLQIAVELSSKVFKYMISYLDSRLLSVFDAFQKIENENLVVTASDLARELCISQTDARRKLRALIASGLVEESGRGARGVILYNSLSSIQNLIEDLFI